LASETGKGTSRLEQHIRPLLLRNLIKKMLLLAPLVAAVLLTTGTAAAKAPCWQELINDWYDGRIDKTYAIPCYREAINHLPADVENYSSARDDITRALQARIAQEKGIKTGAIPPSSTGKNGGGKGGGNKPGGGGPFKNVAKDIGPKNATSVPIPLIVLAAIAGLLLAAGSAGFIARRVRARRIPITPDGGSPQA
jgi:hypothetical protein